MSHALNRPAPVRILGIRTSDRRQVK